MSKKLMHGLASIVLALGFSGTLTAQQLNAEDTWALRQVQNMLNNPAERQQEIGKSPAAQAAHQNALNTVGSQNIDELYAISAIVMEDLVRSTGGDVVKMQSVLANAKANPRAFYQQLSPQAIQAIKRLAPKVKGGQLTH